MFQSRNRDTSIFRKIRIFASVDFLARFNLVIEILLFSVISSGNENAINHEFQSRNRDTSIFSDNSDLVAVPPQRSVSIS